MSALLRERGLALVALVLALAGLAAGGHAGSEPRVAVVAAARPLAAGAVLQPGAGGGNAVAWWQAHQPLQVTEGWRAAANKSQTVLVFASPAGSIGQQPREDLLREARRRLAGNPGGYVQKIYGEYDGGGTQCLYISHVPFEKIGLPTLTAESTPSLQRTIQHSIYKGFAAPVALYGLLGAVLLRNRRKEGSAS